MEPMCCIEVQAMHRSIQQELQVYRMEFKPHLHRHADSRPHVNAEDGGQYSVVIHAPVWPIELQIHRRVTVRRSSLDPAIQAHEQQGVTLRSGQHLNSDFR